MELTVIIPAHNPDGGRLRRVLLGLRAQTLPVSRWETILVDNASARFPDAAFFADCAPENFAIVHEPTPGLTAARRRGFASARSNLAVLVDDDNVLASDYLEQVLAIFAAHPRVGTAGGKSQPEFTAEPPAWTREFFPLLALRDPGENEIISRGLRPAGAAHDEYPLCAPIGAGMALRREAWTAWLGSPHTLLSDRRGGELTSSGDNDIVLSALRAGWEAGYFPQLSLTHLIPAARLDAGYLARLNRGIQKSWMQVLALHDASPWPPISPASAAFRKAKAWFVHRAWSSPPAHIRWQGACGHFDGRVTARLEPALDRLSPPAFVAAATLASLALSLFFFSPSLWILSRPLPGSFEWTRALAFMQQCEAPFSRDSPDIALSWRFFPPVCCHLLGLHGKATLAFPYVGLLLLLGQVAWLGWRCTGDRLLSLGVTALVATTSATLTVTGWLGLNDAWYLFFLVTAAFARSKLAIFVACLLGPWVDERFVLALPLAVLLQLFPPASAQPPRMNSIILPAIGGLAPYVFTRLGWSLFGSSELQSRYLTGVLHEFTAWLPWAPLGWLAGLRAGWLPVFVAFFLIRQQHGRLAVTMSVAAATAGLGILLLVAADLTRAAPLLLPAMLAGCWWAALRWSRTTVRSALAVVLALNLALPAIHVSYTKVRWISPLPMELVRLLHHG